MLVTVGGQFLGSWKGEYFIDVSKAHFSGDGIMAEVVKDVEPMRERDANVLRQKAQQLLKNKPDAQARKEIARIKRTVTRYQSARIVKQTYPAIGDTVTVRVTLAADAAPGPREIRLETPRGISNPLRFFVGRLPEFQKPEPEIVLDARDPSQPSYPPVPTTDITLPAVVNGQIIPRNPEMLWQRSDRFTPGTADRYRFEARKGKRAMRLLEHPRFRAAYDFLLLRAEAGEVEQELADWWTHFQTQDASEQRQMTAQGKRGRRGRRRRKPSAKQTQDA